MPDSHRILLCYDRSEGSRHAIETTGELFPGRKTIVLHAWSPMAVIASSYGGPVSLPAYDDRELRKAASKITDEGVHLATAAGLDAEPETTEVTFKGTWHAILAAADYHDATLVALGARGLSTFRSIVLGSVSHGVAQHAHRPVLIVPPAAPSDRVDAPPEHMAATG